MKADPEGLGKRIAQRYVIRGMRPNARELAEQSGVSVIVQDNPPEAQPGLRAEYRHDPPQIILYRDPLELLSGAIHAVGHKCPHYEEKLEHGALFGNQIICKSHFARMDVTTGRVIAPPAYNDLPVYPVKVEGDEVWLGPVEKPKFPKPAAALGSDPRTFLIVGAGAAGNMAAETLRREGFAGRIVMITGETIAVKLMRLVKPPCN